MDKINNQSDPKAVPGKEEMLKRMLDWHDRMLKEKRFNIPLDHEQSEYLSWLAFELEKYFAASNEEFYPNGEGYESETSQTEKDIKEIEDKAVQQAAKEYAKTDWKNMDGEYVIDSEKYNHFLAGASFNKDAVEFPFAEWASHSDWTYLPSKKLWYNEEDEENITPKTTQELYNFYKNRG